MSLRRVAFFAACALAALALWLAARGLAPGGAGGALLLLALAGLAPWAGLSLMQAVLGLAILRLAPDPAAHVLPALRGAAGSLGGRCAVLVCVRDEDPDAIAALCEALSGELSPDRYDIWILSDTQDLALRAAEDAKFIALSQDVAGKTRIFLRRRSGNAGYKAGNVITFLDAEGHSYEAAVVLDADSRMSGAAVRRLVAVLAADSRIALVQQLIAGRPTRDPFARLFQAGMRALLRPWAVAQGWWQGPQGPYWGHNAAFRVAPFRAHARPPVLPDGTPVLSHDQAEAAALVRAGWQVWLLPDDAGSQEGSPPGLPELLARDTRWAAGNMQYLRLVAAPGLPPMARWQLLQAMLMVLAAPLWLLAFAGALWCAAAGGLDHAGGGAIAAVMAAWALAWHAPKLAGWWDIAAREGGRPAASAALEALFAWALAPVAVLHKGAFLLALPFGARRGWRPQRRAGRRIPWGEAARLFWPHTLAGLVAFGALAATAPWALPFALAWAGALPLAIPFCVWTSDPRLGAWLARRGLVPAPGEDTSA